MGNGFLAKAKPFNGVMLPCKACKKVATEGQEIYMQNIGTGEQKQWIACQDLECFKAQGGSYDPNAPKKQWAGKKARTSEEKLNDINTMHEVCWNKAQAEALKEYPITAGSVTIPNTGGTATMQFQQNQSIDLNRKDRLILAEVFYKAYIENWIR